MLAIYISTEICYTVLNGWSYMPKGSQHFSIDRCSSLSNTPTQTLTLANSTNSSLSNTLPLYPPRFNQNPCPCGMLYCPCGMLFYNVVCFFKTTEIFNLGYLKVRND